MRSCFRAFIRGLSTINEFAKLGGIGISARLSWNFASKVNNLKY